MTMPEESAPKTESTDQTLGRPGGDSGREPGTDQEDLPAVGAALQDALQEADRDGDDLTRE